MITTLLTSVPITRQRTNRRVDSSLLHVLKLHESHVMSLCLLPVHPGRCYLGATSHWTGPVSPSECPHRPVVPAEAAQTAACVLRTLATVTTIPATGAPAYCLQQHCCPSKETKLGVILLALAVNVSLRLILGYQIAYLGRKISSLHLILVVKWHFHDNKFFVPQKRP